MDAQEAYDRATQLDPNLVELKSRWRVDAELNKLRESKDSDQILKAMRESATGVQEKQLDRMEQRKELAPLWRDMKPNPAFLWQSDDGLDRLEAGDEILRAMTVLSLC